ncbi:MAG: hypothetical protein OI717_00015 (plasmid) [Candidatus Methanoperedens sp.]|nr:MAG: hypothetical protein OI717_00015 [Candidatus Methanoperedens sp.]
MVQVTKGKNVVIETYDAEFKEFTATAAQTDFTMANKAGETTSEYTRVYVDNVEVASADITVSSATPAIVTIPACTVGQIVQVYMPKTKNGAYSVQQAIQMKVSTKTIEIAELGNDAVTVDVVQRSGALNVAFAQATNHDLMTKFTDSAKNDAFMVIAKKYSNTTPVSYRIFKEARVNEMNDSLEAGGIAMETFTLTFKHPVAFKTT